MKRELRIGRSFVTMAIVVLATLALASPRAGAAVWTVTDLNPAGAFKSAGVAVDPTGQTGIADLATFHVNTWTGTAASASDVNPPTAGTAFGTGIDGTKLSAFGDVGFSTNHAFYSANSGAAWVDLHPTGKAASTANDVGGTYQVGETDGQAAMWIGTSASYVDLAVNNTWMTGSNVRGTDGAAMVGYYKHPSASFNNASIWALDAGAPNGVAQGYVDPFGASDDAELEATSGSLKVGHGVTGGTRHAFLAKGTALPTGGLDDMIGTHGYVITDLNPAGATASRAMGTDGTNIAGYANIGGIDKAIIWTSETAASALDLHAVTTGYNWTQASGVATLGANTWVIGFGEETASGSLHALLWNIPEPASLGLLAVGGLMMLSRRRIK